MIQHSLQDLRKSDQSKGAINNDSNLTYWSSKGKALCYPLHYISGVQSPGPLPHRGKSLSAILDSACSSK